MSHDEGELKPTEERLVRVSVLQELTVAALDLFDPRRSMNDFLDRLATRMGALAALCISDERGGLKLQGSSGLSRSSRALALRGPVPAAGLDALELPYPELAVPATVRWAFPLESDPVTASRSALLLFFAGAPRVPAQYHGVAARIADVLRTALLHRRLYARTLESERRLYEQKTMLECQRDASLDGMLFVSASGETTVNRRLCEMLQIAPDGGDFLRRMREVIAAPAEAVERLDKLLASKDERALQQVVLRDGRVFEISSSPVRSGEGVHYGRAFYLRDISELRRAEQERAELLAQEKVARAQAEDARRRASFLAEASRILANSLDYKSTLERMARLALPDFADWCIVDVIDEDDRPRRVAVAHADPSRLPLLEQMRSGFPANPRWAERLEALLIEGKPKLYETVSDEQVRLLAQSEEHAALLRRLGIGSVLLVPLMARGRRIGAITLVYGFSGRQYRSEDLALAEDLGRRAALAVDNARLFSRAQESVRVRDEFLSIASHELRTPVTSLQLAIQGLVRLSGGDLSRAPRGFVTSSLQVADRQTSRMAQLIDKLLDVSRIQAGRLELQLEEVDLAALVAEAVQSARPAAAAAGCTLDMKGQGPLVGRWDRWRLEQVLTNLLSNALKYGAGGAVEVAFERDEALARLIVIDHGIGIPLERQQRIFDRFERAVSNRHYSGLGLGLYIVQRVLEALGGRISVRSSPGAGSTFSVELPLAGPQAKAVDEEESGEGRGAA